MELNFMFLWKLEIKMNIKKYFLFQRKTVFCEWKQVKIGAFNPLPSEL